MLFCLHMNTRMCVHLYICNAHKPVCCYEGHSVEHDFDIQSYLKRGILNSWDGNSPRASVHVVPQVGAQLPWLQDAIMVSHRNEGYY